MPTTKYKKHRADKGFREFIALNKLSARLTGKYSESPTFFIQTVTHKQKKRERMINLLQENIEKESLRTNCTFDFYPIPCHLWNNPQKVVRLWIE